MTSSSAQSSPTSILPALGLILILLLLCPHRISGTDYYVRPTNESDCPSTTSADLCRTLDEYAKSAQELKGEVTMLFLGGVHYLTLDLKLSNLNSFQMKQAEGHEMVIIRLLCCNIMIIQPISGLTAKNLTIQSPTECMHSPKFVINTTQANFQQLHIAGVSITVTIDVDAAISTANVIIRESVLEQSTGTGLQVTDHRSLGHWLYFHLLNSNISHHQQGGIIIESSTTLNVNISGSTIKGNNITLSSASNAAGLSVYSTQSHTARVYISNCHFIDNQDLRGHPVTVYISRAVAVNVTNCDFQDNRGIAIRVANVDNGIYLHDKVTFLRNSAQQGGALALVSTYVSFMQFSHVVFVDNSADDVGGAIFVESTSTTYEENDPNTLGYCFYRLPEWQYDPDDYNVTFSRNSAKNGGQHIYGAALMSYCVVFKLQNIGQPNIRSINPEVQRIFHFSDTQVSPISSNPSRVCILNQAVSNQSYDQYCSNKSQIFKTSRAIPGEEFHVEAVLVGAEFGTGTGAVYAQFLTHNDTKANLHSSYQYSQQVSQTNTTQTLYYSIFSSNSYEIMVLTAAYGTILVNGDEGQIDQAINKYEKFRVIPSLLLTTPVYINVTLSNCPSGFFLNRASMGCECNPSLCNDQIKWKFSNGMGLVYLGENVWVKAYNNGDVSGIIKQQNCPFDYCKINKLLGLDLDRPDTQCAMNHAGTLCGQCETGFSLAIGSNKCLDCRDSNGLYLIIFFAIAGFLLVFFIKILNLTVTQGTINGLIFYSNIIWGYQNIFFPEALIGKFPFFYAFIAWVNLDFGIETCFFQGLTAFWKTWLQFLFPLYIWGIAGGIILLARSSKRMTKLFGENPVQVLATLFLLSYTKLLRIMISVLVSATLNVYTDDGKPVESPTTLVWALDGNLLYGRVPHVFLMLAILLVVIPFLWLPYTFALLFIQPLRKHSELKCLNWVNRLKPFFDAYIEPLNAPNYQWVGLLLLARFILLLMFTLLYANDPSSTLLTLVVVTVFLLMVLSYTGQLYDHPTRFNSHFLPGTISFRSILEVSFLFNLVAVGVGVLYLREDTEAKEVITYVSVGIAFIQFVGIVLYHFLLVLKNLICKSATTDAVASEGYQNLDEEQEAATPPTTSSIIMDAPVSSSDCRANSYHDTSNGYREPLLTESTA